MTFSFGYSTLLISLIPLVFLLANHVYAEKLHLYHNKVTDELLDSICETTINSSFCFTTLRSRLHPATTLGQLAKLTIDFANAQAVATEEKIKSAMETNCTRIEGYAACSKDYADAISALKDASRDIARGLYGDVKNNAQNALEEARSCESKKPVGDDESPLWLHERNRNLEQHSSIIVALANQLKKERIRGMSTTYY